MSLTVRELLDLKESSNLTLISGAAGIDNEITGVTIIEAPDIVKFITGGELLLTGLYAFNSCSLADYKKYVYELNMKKPGGIAVKTSRNVEDAETKINLLKKFTESAGIPLIEVPFDVSFQMIMSVVMEHIFNEEVTRLKYDKTTRDNFSVLTLAHNKKSNLIPDILDMLNKLIHNPVALYDHNFSCFGSTGNQNNDFEMSHQARRFTPEYFTKYDYYTQKGNNQSTEYIVHINLNVGTEIYLVITESESHFTTMDCIAIENAIIALQYEFTRKFTLSTVEKKFQSDILHNLLKGSISSHEELENSAVMADLPIDGEFQVVLFNAESNTPEEENIKKKLKYADNLEAIVRDLIPEGRTLRNIADVALIVQRETDVPLASQRSELNDRLLLVQKAVDKKYKHITIKAGMGNKITGLRHLHDSYKEAKDALFFLNTSGNVISATSTNAMLFSDLGIFQLLCDIKDPSQLEEYIPESLEKLFNYNKSQRDDLILTLNTYLDRNQNMSKTAQDLFVHYKTAAYRIEKIADLTGINFDDPNETLAVRIGLIVHKIMEHLSYTL